MLKQLNTDVTGPTNNGSTGLLTPVWRILESLLANVQNRLDLLQTEAESQMVRFVEIVLLASAIIIFGTLALTVTCLVVVLLVWNDGPLIALSALIATYAFAAAWAGSALRKRLTGPFLFEATSEELRKDRECIPHPQ